MPERIEGEFHYAERKESAKGEVYYTVFRTADNHNCGSLFDRYSEGFPKVLSMTAKEQAMTRIESRDDGARFFRAAALAEVDAAADRHRAAVASGGFDVYFVGGRYCLEVGTQAFSAPTLTAALLSDGEAS